MQNSAARIRYYVDMAILGFLYLILTFLCCFALVHVIKLAYYGFLSLKKKPQPPEEPKPKEEPKQPKPVYYIVEKKRSKRTYSQPKEIEFK